MARDLAACAAAGAEAYAALIEGLEPPAGSAEALAGERARKLRARARTWRALLIWARHSED
jgi:hypothetical protein